MEKRAVFDNPFGYEPVSPYRIRYQRAPVSPYRIRYQRARAGDKQIVNLPGDFGNSINKMKSAAESISNAAQQMGENISTLNQQNATIINDFAGLRDAVTAQGDPDRIWLDWNEDNSTVYVHGLTSKVKRGSQTYNDLVAAGRVERDRWMVKPEQQPMNVTNQIIQQNEVTSIIDKLKEVIAVMNSFDIQVNLAGIHSAIAGVAQRINFLED